MITEKIGSELMDNSIKRYKLSPTITDKAMPKEICNTCGSFLVPMRLDKSPNTGAGFMPSDNKCIFYGCQNCITVLYDKDELKTYTSGQEASLKALLSGIFGIE